jgi:hypothetical protein
METIVERNLALMQKIADEATTCLKAKTSAEWKKHSAQITSFMSAVTENLAQADALEKRLAQQAEENAKEVKTLQERIAKLKSCGEDPIFAAMIAEAEKKIDELLAGIPTKPAGFAGVAVKNVDAYEAAREEVVRKPKAAGGAGADAPAKPKAAFSGESTLPDYVLRKIKKRYAAVKDKIAESAKRCGIPEDAIHQTPCNKGCECPYGFLCTFWHSEGDYASFLKREKSRI